MSEISPMKVLEGHEVHIERADGRRHDGTLLNVNRRSLWLVEGDVDVLIPLDQVTVLRSA